MNRGSPVATRTDTSRPDATLFRSRALAGRISAEKREELGATRANAGVEAAVLTLPDSIAWLLNVRGGDVVHSPLPLSFALLHADGGVEWFVDPDKLTPEVTAGLGNAVRSEEHTSEPVTNAHLVCRLLLEKKNKKSTQVKHANYINNNTQQKTKD